MERQSELINFDITSLLKSIADIPNFKPEHLTKVLELSYERIEDLQVKDLNH